MVKPWAFDDQVAENFRQHARQHIPGYERVLEKCAAICCNQLDKNARIIDVGCAVGETLELLSREGFVNLVGVDNSPSMLEHVIPGIAELHCSDKLPEMTYDAVLMNWTLHFVPNKYRYLESICANLNPGGFLILSDKTSNDPPYLSLYHEYKQRHGVGIEEINNKAASLKGKMFIDDQNWYKYALLDVGFSDITIIDADWCFTTFIAWKHDA